MRVGGSPLQEMLRLKQVAAQMVSSLPGALSNIQLCPISHSTLPYQTFNLVGQERNPEGVDLRTKAVQNR